MSNNFLERDESEVGHYQIVSPLAKYRRFSDEMRILRNTTRETENTVTAALAMGRAVIAAAEAKRAADSAYIDANEALRKTGVIKAPEGHVFLVVVDRYQYEEYDFQSYWYQGGSCSGGMDKSGLSTVQHIEEGDNQKYAFVGNEVDTTFALQELPVSEGIRRRAIAEVKAHPDFSEGLSNIVISSYEQVHLLPIDQIPEDLALVNYPAEIKQTA